MKIRNMLVLSMVVCVWFGFTAAKFTTASNAKFAPDFNFKEKGTFAWTKNAGKIRSSIKDDKIKSRIFNAIEKELNLKGYKLGDEQEADFLVDYLGATDSNKASEIYLRYGYAPGISFNPEEESQIKEANLVIDILDPNGNMIVWRGYAFGDVDFSEAESQKDKRAKKVVKKVFKDFPPR